MKLEELLKVTSTDQEISITIEEHYQNSGGISWTEVFRGKSYKLLLHEQYDYLLSLKVDALYTYNDCIEITVIK